MSVAISISKDLTLLPSIVAETRLLRHFTGEEGAFLIERESYLKNEKYFLALAQSHNIAGFGRGSTKRMAFVKAIAEFYERRLMFEAFAGELSHVPRALQTSNGFAVHFSQDLAIRAATNEAIERHLLQYSFLKDGWSGFELIRREKIGEETLTFVSTKYSINAIRAGMVIATSSRFPGVSFGYFVDEADKIKFSPRWSHAVFEARDKIDPFLKLAQSSKASDLMPIDQGILKWMMTPHEEIDFIEGGLIQALPIPHIEIQTFDLAHRWGLDFPLFGAYGFSQDFLPLLVIDRLKESDSKLVLGLLEKFGLPAHIPERNPVL